MSANSCESAFDHYIDSDSEELVKMEAILIRNQIIRNELKARNELISNRIECSQQLNASEVWKLDRIDGLVQLLDTDCQHMSHIDTQSTVICEQLDQRIKELINSLEIINSMKDLDDLSEIDLIRKMSENLDKSEDNSNQKVMNRLREEINKMETQLALIDVSILENHSIEELVKIETELKAEVERVENDVKRLRRELTVDELTRLAIEADIAQLEQQVQSFA